MDYQERQAIAIEEANKLQHTANGLQQTMINEMETNNRVTSTHNKVIIALTVAIVIVGFITLLTNYNKPGRYAISGQYVLDTKTSQLWLRARTETGVAYFGTNENPTFERPR